MSHSLQDAPRSGAPRRFSSPVRAQVTALACSLPRSHGIPLSRWSLGELARQVAAPQRFQPSQKEQSDAGWLPRRSILGVTIVGSTSRTPKNFWRVLVRCSICMSRLRPCLSKGSGWCVLMRKLRSRLAKLNKPPDQLSANIPCINPHATRAVAHST
jgi:hypothetical protein